MVFKIYLGLWECVHLNDFIGLLFSAWAPPKIDDRTKEAWFTFRHTLVNIWSDMSVHNVPV